MDRHSGAHHHTHQQGDEEWEVTEEVQTAKTGWDWLSLLMVPLILGLITLWFTIQQREAQQKADIAQKETQQKADSAQKETQRQTEQLRAQNEALQKYLDEMRLLTLEAIFIDP